MQQSIKEQEESADKNSFVCNGRSVYYLSSAVFSIVKFLDPEGGYQKATQAVLLVVVISSLKIPKVFLICSGVQQNFAHNIPADIPHRYTVSDF